MYYLHCVHRAIPRSQHHRHSELSIKKKTVLIIFKIQKQTKSLGELEIY